jgi:hypothetical protein
LETSVTWRSSTAEQQYTCRNNGANLGLDGAKGLLGGQGRRQGETRQMCPLDLERKL